MGARSKKNSKWLTNVEPRLSEIRVVFRSLNPYICNYVEPRLSEIRDWCMQGLTNEEMSKRLDINPDTWYRYMKEHEILHELVQASKSVMDTKVENALLKTALGFEYVEIKTIIEEDKNGKKRTRIEKTKKYMPHNPTAQAFWLKNRKCYEWGDRKEIIFEQRLKN